MNTIQNTKVLTIGQSADLFVKGKKEYYKQWMFDKPILVSKKTLEVANLLQKLMHKGINRFVRNYDQYASMMPLSHKVSEIIKIFEEKEYQVGTYRTDFVFDSENNMRLIEITCRFALNGLFLPSIMESVAADHKHTYLRDAKTKDTYSRIFGYMKNRFGDTNRIYVLKGSDTRNASKIYTELLSRCGYIMEDVSYENLDELVHTIEDQAVIISELTLEEIESLNLQTITELSTKNIINDFRTVFLIHDKRFFAVLHNDAFLSDTFTTEEIAFWKNYTIPTYTRIADHSILWEQAKGNKSDWIIKHSTLGKSQKIYAGLVMTEAEWNNIFLDDELDMMILQRWIPQTTVEGTVNGKKHSDFVTGTLLFVDDEFFGFGDFRTSSHPVINVVDHRKYCSLIMDEELGESHRENYYTF